MFSRASHAGRAKTFVIMFMLVAPANFTAFADNSSIGSRTKGMTCEQKLEIARKFYDADCRPGFGQLALDSDCSTVCASNTAFGGKDQCQKQCHDCLGWLKVIEDNKACGAATE